MELICLQGSWMYIHRNGHWISNISWSQRSFGSTGQNLACFRDTQWEQLGGLFAASELQTRWLFIHLYYCRMNLTDIYLFSIWKGYSFPIRVIPCRIHSPNCWQLNMEKRSHLCALSYNQIKEYQQKRLCNISIFQICPQKFSIFQIVSKCWPSINCWTIVDPWDWFYVNTIFWMLLQKHQFLLYPAVC